MKQGLMMCTYQTLHDLPNFFRLALENSGLNEEDMDRMITIFEQLGGGYVKSIRNVLRFSDNIHIFVNAEFFLNLKNRAL